MALALRSASPAPRRPWPAARRATRARSPPPAQPSTSRCGSPTSAPAERSATSRRPGRSMTPYGESPVEPICYCLTARSGRTTSSRPWGSRRRRRARWAIFRSAGRVAAWSCCRGSTRSEWFSCTSTTRIQSCVAARRSERGSRRRASWWERTQWSSSCERRGEPGCDRGPGGSAARRARAPLPPPPPLQPANAPGRAVARRAAGAGGGNAEPLPVGGSRGTAVFQESAHASTARRGVRARPGDGAVPRTAGSSAGRGGARIQVRRPLVSAGLRGARAPSRDDRMTAAGRPSVPRLHPKARLQHDDVRGRDVLLYPEGLVALNPTGAEILELCDGVRSVADVVATLERRYGAAGEAGGVERDVTAFLDGLAAKGLVTYGS